MKNLLTAFLLVCIGSTAGLALAPRYVSIGPNMFEYATALGSFRALELGLIEGADIETKFGYNLDIDTGAEESIRSQGGTQVPTTAAETVTLVSTNAADAAAGTGARNIAVKCVDEDYNVVIINMIPNGTTPVVSTQTCRAVNGMNATSVGSGGTNAGAITMAQSSSSISLRQMPAGDSVSQSCTYLVPDGKVAFLEFLKFSSIRQGSGAPEVRVYSNVYDPATGVTTRSLRLSFDTSAEGGDSVDSPFSSPIPEHVLIWFSADTDTNNTQVSCRGRFLIIDEAVIL